MVRAFRLETAIPIVAGTIAATATMGMDGSTLRTRAITVATELTGPTMGMVMAEAITEHPSMADIEIMDTDVAIDGKSNND